MGIKEYIESKKDFAKKAIVGGVALATLATMASCDNNIVEQEDTTMPNETTVYAQTMETTTPSDTTSEITEEITTPVETTTEITTPKPQGFQSAKEASTELEEILKNKEVGFNLKSIDIISEDNLSKTFISCVSDTYEYILFNISAETFESIKTLIKDALQNDPQAKEGLYWGRTYNRHNDMETYYLAINKIGMQSDSNTELMNIVYNEIANCAEADITKISSPSPEMGN